MPRLALDHAAQHDHAVHIGVLGEKLRSEGKFERPGDAFHFDILFVAPGVFQRTHRSFEQRAGDLLVPLRHHDADPHIRRRGQCARCRQIFGTVAPGLFKLAFFVQVHTGDLFIFL